MIQFNPRHWQILKEGSLTQRQVYEILKETSIFDILKPFDPAHIGTFGNDIDILGSDIDIICSAEDLSVFSAVMQESFGKFPGCTLEESKQHGATALVARIQMSIPIEIYAEQTLVNNQLGYRHYIIACRVLDIFGDIAHEEIRARKLSGAKSEPALAAFLGLAGDPYTALLKLEQMSDQAIRLLRASMIGSDVNRT